MNETLKENDWSERKERELDRSVNCYFCGELFSDNDCLPADEHNNDDGGSICEVCVRKYAKEEQTGPIFGPGCMIVD